MDDGGAASARASGDDPALLAAASFAASHLLQGTGPLPMAEVLTLLGETVGASRACLVAAQVPPPGSDAGPRMDVRHQWGASGVPRLHAGPNGWLSYPPRWLAAMQRGDLVVGRARDLTEAERSLLEAEGTRAMVLAPVWSGDRLYGHLSVCDGSRERSWSASELELLRAIANVVGGAIDRRATVAALERRGAILRIASEIAVALHDVEDPEAHVPRLLEQVRSATRTQSAWLRVLDRSAAEPATVTVAEAVAPGSGPARPDGLAEAIGSLAPSAAASGAVLLEPDAAGEDAWERAALDRRRTSRWMAVPVAAGEPGAVTIAALGVEADQPRAWDDGEVEGLRVVATALATARRRAARDGRDGR